MLEKSFDLNYDMGCVNFIQNLFMCQILENCIKVLEKNLETLDIFVLYKKLQTLVKFTFSKICSHLEGKM